MSETMSAWQEAELEGMAKVIRTMMADRSQIRDALIEERTKRLFLERQLVVWQDVLERIYNATAPRGAWGMPDTVRIRDIGFMANEALNWMPAADDPVPDPEDGNGEEANAGGDSRRHGAEGGPADSHAKT